MVAALRRLAERHHSGEVWVAPTTTLLHHHELQRSLRWEARGDSISIEPGQGDLSGLTFYGDATEVVVGEQRAELRVNDADDSGRRSITVL